MPPRSVQLFKRAQNSIPGGVNSPVRAFKGVGGEPVFIHHGIGPYLVDEDSKEYIDYICSWGALLLGHNNPAIRSAVIAQLESGMGFGATTEIEVQLAEKLCDLVPAMEMVRLVNSGTEATMSAIRLARGHTQRDKIIKFNGCYHGHCDALLVNAGSGPLTLNSPSSAGVPEAFVQHTLTANFNDLDSVSQCFEAHPDSIAAVIIEPIPGNMNLVLPNPNFLQGLRSLCDQYGALLIFDEVMSGFRVGLGGASQLYAIEPDITTLGKVIGGGLPVGAFGGRSDVMQSLAPLGDVYQAGTLSGNPVAVRAGLTQLSIIEKPGFHDKLNELCQHLVQGAIEIAQGHRYPLFAQSIGGMFGLYFNSGTDFSSFDAIKRCNLKDFQTFHHLALEQGVYFAPSMYEAGFISAAHDAKIINHTLSIIDNCIGQLANATH